MDIKDVINSVAKDKQSEEKKVDETFQLVVFGLDAEEYGVAITDLREIIKVQEITPIPNSPEFIRGILNLRGKIVVVVDLEKRFDLKRDTPITAQHIIVTELGDSTFGILVDKVTEVLRVPISKIQATPSLVSAKIQVDYLKGVVVLTPETKSENQPVTQTSRLILLIDLPKLLNESELLKLDQKIKKETNEL